MKELALTLKRIAADERVTALYLPHEEHAVRAHIEQAERAGTPRPILERELEFLHLMKAEFEATLVP